MFPAGLLPTSGAPRRCRRPLQAGLEHGIDRYGRGADFVPQRGKPRWLTEPRWRAEPTGQAPRASIAKLPVVESALPL
ncbi:hypothetical protein CXK92_18190 [Stutzerimonas stutzeri]|uniref:Uncharacterized protein n=1 Tax=Stutzerimonas stutzeri TaxID=316 RepID=A0A2N8RYH5_STUST|nr:hypothetical protein CXK92_18190 [Stutzerimonas stutzeri]